jgi:hypothetical protein
VKEDSSQAAWPAGTAPHPAGRRAEIRLSVIIPLGPHETEGAVLLEQLQALPGDAEIVLAGARGHPLPAQLEPHAGAIAASSCTAPPGRARQMNAGARAARGRWLWFVHADSRLHPRTLAALAGFLAADRDTLGYFDLRYRGDGPRLAKLNALGANLRARWLGLPFGDQGFVIPAGWFGRLGGYDESAVRGEDHRLVWRARGAGLVLRRVPAPLLSSARKYARRGWARTTLSHIDLTARQAWTQWRTLQSPREMQNP